MKLGKADLVPRRHVEITATRATNRAPEGVTVKLYDQENDPGDTEPWEGNQ